MHKKVIVPQLHLWLRNTWQYLVTLQNLSVQKNFVVSCIECLILKRFFSGFWATIWISMQHWYLVFAQLIQPSLFYLFCDTCFGLKYWSFLLHCQQWCLNYFFRQKNWSEIIVLISMVNDLWEHAKIRKCFVRSISKIKYKDHKTSKELI